MSDLDAIRARDANPDPQAPLAEGLKEAHGFRNIIRARDAAEYSPGTRMASLMEARAIEDRHDLLAEVDRLENEVYSWEMNATAAAMGVGRDIERARILELINVLPSTHIEWVAAETGERTVMGDRYVAIAAVIAAIEGETT